MVINNKKGAESFTVILWIIVGVIVVGLFIYAYYQGFLPVLTGTKNLPKELEVTIQACNALGETPLDYSYCEQLRDLGDNEMVTCDYLESDGKLKAGVVKTCSVEPGAFGGKMCKVEKTANSNTKLKINGVDCKTVVIAPPATPP